MFGGGSHKDPKAFNELWRYSNELWTFVRVSAAVPGEVPNVPAARFKHTWIIDADKLISDPDDSRYGFVFGGFDVSGGPLGDLWKFDHVTEVWDPVIPNGPSPSKRSAAVGVRVNGPVRTHFVIYGGVGTDGAKDDIWMFDTSALEWKEVSVDVSPKKRKNFGFTTLPGKFFIFGGEGVSDVWLFDGVKKSWTELKYVKALFGNPGRSGQLVTAVDGVHFVQFAGNTGVKIVDSIMSFNSVLEEWVPIELPTTVTIPTIRQDIGADATCGNVFFFGGFTGTAALDDLWMMTYVWVN